MGDYPTDLLSWAEEMDRVADMFRDEGFSRSIEEGNRALAKMLRQAAAENAALRERVTVLERVHRAANDAVNGVGDPRWQYPLVLALQDAAKSAENGAGGG